MSNKMIIVILKLSIDKTLKTYYNDTQIEGDKINASIINCKTSIEKFAEKGGKIMASSKPKVSKKDGKVHAYEITVSMGRHPNGSKIIKTTTWKIPSDMTNPKVIQKELKRQEILFEEKCKKNTIPADKRTFEEYAEYVLGLKERDNKHKTVVRYRELNGRVIPEIGFMKLSDVTSKNINDIMLKLAKPGENKKDPTKGLSPKTIREHYRWIHVVYEQARKEGLMQYNPADNATPPKVKRKEAEYFEIETVLKIKECLEKEPFKWRMITLLFIASGARRGEIMGLKWSKVNFEDNTIHIDNNLLYTPDIGVYEDSPKNGENRFVKIDPQIMALLKEHRINQRMLFMRNGKRWKEDSFCFTQENGERMHPDSITDWLDKFSNKHNLPHIHPHAFRHTYISILVANHVDFATIAKLAGHKQVSTTENFYSHVLKDAEENAANVISELIFNDKANIG